ncbi:monocarboxylate transporter, putative, partial [Ixodes scapularis]
RAVACGVSYAGLTIGGLIFPPLFQCLVDEYSTRGMLLMAGALMLNATAGALLQRLPPDTTPGPPPFENKDSAYIPLDENKENEISLKNGARPFTETENRSKKVKSLLSEGSEIDDAYYETQKHRVRPKKTNIRFKVNFPSYLKLPKFYLLSFSNGISTFIMSTYLAVIVDFATDRNISKWNAVLLLTFYSMGDLAARMGSGWITDKGFIGKNFMMAVSLFVCAVSLCLMPFCHAFYLHAFLAIVVGWCNGATLILVPVFYMDLVDADSFSECFGICIFVAGVMLLPRPLLVGK